MNIITKKKRILHREKLLFWWGIIERRCFPGAQNVQIRPCREVYSSNEIHFLNKIRVSDKIRYQRIIFPDEFDFRQMFSNIILRILRDASRIALFRLSVCLTGNPHSEITWQRRVHLSKYSLSRSIFLSTVQHKSLSSIKRIKRLRQNKSVFFFMFNRTYPLL